MALNFHRKNFLSPNSFEDICRVLSVRGHNLISKYNIENDKKI